MAKKIHSFWRFLLGSIITLLGFTACKTTRKVQKEDNMMILYGPPPGAIAEKQEKQSPEEAKVHYWLQQK